jgi:ubiquinone/menaquinone biosynthesis C-methylase UbiE
MLINGIPLPPQEFMDAVSGKNVTPEEHFAVGKQFSEMLRAYCYLRPENNVLDVGSGCGRIASHFVGYVTGQYHGFDVVSSMVDWCNANIAAQHPNFSFHHADLTNTLYSDSGQDASTYVFPFEDNTFDTVFAASVFTHLLPPSARQYAREVCRVLVPGGFAALSFLLTNDAWRRRVASGDKIYVPLPYQCEGYRTQMLDNPEGTTAFEESDALQIMTDAGLTVREVSLGSWANNEGWTFQDIILSTKA